MNRLSIIFAGLLLAPLLGVNALRLQAQTKAQPVTLSVGLTDRAGNAVTTIPPREIAVYEEGEPQKILSATREDGPVSIGILIDISSSQRKHFPAVLEAVQSFLASSADDDEFFVVMFGERITLLSDFADRKTTLEKLTPPAFEKRSKVYEAIHYGLAQIQHGKFSRRALLLLSDGQDGGSQVSYGQLFNAIKASDAQIYCLGVGNTNSDEGEGPGNFQIGHLLLEEMATLTGGTAYMKDKSEQLRLEARVMAQQLWHQYRVVYQRPITAGEKKWRKIKVKTTASYSHLKIRARQGYWF